MNDYIGNESEEDPYLLLREWVGDDNELEKKKKNKKKIKPKSRFSSVRRDKFGNRIYKYTGKKRYNAKQKTKEGGLVLNYQPRNQGIKQLLHDLISSSYFFSSAKILNHNLL